MYKIIVFTHGNLSQSLKDTAELISGINELVEYYGIPLGVDTGPVLSKVSASIKESEAAGVDVLVLTDLYFGTPFNLLMTLINNHRFSHIAGVNLPILLEAMAYQEQKDLSFENLIGNLVSKGKEAIVNCDEIVKKINNGA